MDQVKSECETFKKNIFEDFKKGKVIKNPGYYNQYVNEKLSLIYNTLKGKNVINEINQDNFVTAKMSLLKIKKKL